MVIILPAFMLYPSQLDHVLLGAGDLLAALDGVDGAVADHGDLDATCGSDVPSYFEFLLKNNI